ncbi:hypothetical protein MLD38_019005 [Melastoma candidum]|uniref:Uncharacterized protein n=1 Tax=Melastoma candidum TaxID=119954 RepID=A0ACB9QZM4_9MYRT|nr:hypothetical protein MLD38_019005 [Melastoma candidum]
MNELRLGSYAGDEDEEELQVDPDTPKLGLHNYVGDEDKDGEELDDNKGGAVGILTIDDDSDKELWMKWPRSATPRSKRVPRYPELNLPRQADNVDEEGDTRLEDCESSVHMSCQELSDDDGYHTPTSEEHRIPVPTICPPAPPRPRRSSFHGSPGSPPARQRRRLSFSESPGSPVTELFDSPAPGCEDVENRINVNLTCSCRRKMSVQLILH